MIFIVLSPPKKRVSVHSVIRENEYSAITSVAAPEWGAVKGLLPSPTDRRPRRTYVLVVPPTPAPDQGTATPLTPLLRRWGIQFEFKIEPRGDDFLDLLPNIVIRSRAFLLLLHDVEYCVMEHICNHCFLLRK
jgi:hypothetical protein